MFDPLMTLLVAKAKAVGLVAGTALATTALVGGGAVAMTAVSSDSDVEPDVAVVQELETQEADEALSGAATPTVGIQTPAAPVAVQVDADGDGLDDASGLPMGFVCDDSRNHGQNVSAFVHSLPKGPGRGRLVSAVAKSDCGTSARAEQDENEAEDGDQAEKPAKPAKAEKPAKPAKPAKAEKPAKPAKAEKRADRSESATGKRPAKAKPGKSGGKGGGKGKGGKG